MQYLTGFAVLAAAAIWLVQSGAWVFFAAVFAVVLALFLLNFLVECINRANSKPSEPQARPVVTSVDYTALLVEGVSRKLHSIYFENKDELVRQYLMLSRKDRYGSIDNSGWDKEWQYFIDRGIVSKLNQGELVTFNKIDKKPYFDSVLRDMKADVVAAAAVRRTSMPTELKKDCTPIEFEIYCSKLLEGSGWSTVTTKATGDQGADILATKDGITVVFQCKMYNAPVGNKAIQEAFSATTHYMAHYGAVVTNSSYTASAKALAASTDVQLLHVSDLVDYEPRRRTA